MRLRCIFTSILALLASLVLGQKLGSVQVSLDKKSAVRDDVVFYLSNDKFNREYHPPALIKLPAGRYEIYMTATEVNPVRRSFLIISGQRTSLKIRLTPMIGVEQTEITPSTAEFRNNRYLKLFPHEEEDFDVTANFSRDKHGQITITSLTITVHAGQGKHESTATYIQRKKEYIAAAKAWITKQKLPRKTPILIG